MIKTSWLSPAVALRGESGSEAFRLWGVAGGFDQRSIFLINIYKEKHKTLGFGMKAVQFVLFFSREHEEDEIESDMPGLQHTSRGASAMAFSLPQ